MFARAVDFEIEPGMSIRMCTGEDLVVLKAVTGRPQDVVDIEGVVIRQGKYLDATYIRSWLDEFTKTLARPEITERFESAWRGR